MNVRHSALSRWERRPQFGRFSPHEGPLPYAATLPSNSVLRCAAVMTGTGHTGYPTRLKRWSELSR